MLAVATHRMHADLCPRVGTFIARSSYAGLVAGCGLGMVFDLDRVRLLESLRDDSTGKP
jgi:hypothetical protein